MKIKTAVIILGGMGTRVLPITKTISKEMLPIVDVPSVYLLVKEAYLSGIKKIIFVITKRNRHLVENFFSYDDYLMNFIKNQPHKLELVKEVNEIIKSMKFTYVYQREKGSYGSVYSARKYIRDDYFVLMYGDDLVDNEVPLTKQLINEFNRNNVMIIASKKLEYSKLPSVGIIKKDSNNYLIDLVEKGDKENNCVVHGRFILHKSIFTIKDKLTYHDNQELYLPYALLHLKKQVKVFNYQGEYFNIGEKLGFIKASIHYGLKRNDLKDELMDYINNVK